MSKHYYKLSNGNARATYQFQFRDGTMVYAGNSNVGQDGGDWKVRGFMFWFADIKYMHLLSLQHISRTSLNS